jgi:DNA-binding phage protein
MKILDDFISEIKKFGVHKVAKISGVPAWTIYEWTRGKHIPTLVNAQKVANAMGLEFLIFDKLEE